MNAAYYLAVAAVAREDTALVQGIAEQMWLRGLTTETPTDKERR